jgi:hypothetical protein
MVDIQCYRNLAAAICLQAAKDYDKAETPQQRAVIIRQLRSEYMCGISDGASALLADALKRDYKRVVKQIYTDQVRLRKENDLDNEFYADLLMEQQEQM